MLPLLEKLLAIEKPKSGLPKSLFTKYREVGTVLKYEITTIEKGLLFSGRTSTIALKVEFGNRWEFFNTITALREMDADIKMLITSSNSKAMSMETIYTVLKKKLEEKGRWCIVDIERKKEPMFLNFKEKTPSHSEKPSFKNNGVQNRSTSEPEMRKTKNYGMQPVNAPPRKKKIYGKRKKRRI